MKLIAAIAGFLLLVLMIFLAVDKFRAASAPRRAKAVKLGDTKQQVRHVMGPPSGVTTAGIFNGAETWAYGGHVDWAKFKSFPPIRIRLFGPDADEVAIQFDTNGTVSRVAIPKP